MPVQLFTMIGGPALVAFMHTTRLAVWEGAERRKVGPLGAGVDSDDMILARENRLQEPLYTRV